jgi:hypothetical protein
MEDSMKKTIAQVLVLVLLVFAGTMASAQQETQPAVAAQAVASPQAANAPQAAATPAPERVATQPDRTVVPLSNPGKPAKIEASVLRGSITVKGYDGKEVIVEARVRERELAPEGRGGLMGFNVLGKTERFQQDRRLEALAKQYEVLAKVAKEKQKTGEALQKEQEAELALLQSQLGRRDFAIVASPEAQKKSRSHEGMKLITAAMTGLTVEEDNNVVTVETESWKHAIDLTIQVPLSSSLELGATNDGSVTVENVSGEIEINNTNGAIVIKNASGTVVAHTVSGDIEVVLNRISPDKPMSFSNMNGDIDVTLPADVKANVKIKSQMGNIYSDFDVSLKSTPQKAEESGMSEKGKYRVNFDKGIYGTINGGGTELSFNSFNGEIFIRKRK